MTTAPTASARRPLSVFLAGVALGGCTGVAAGWHVPEEAWGGWLQPLVMALLTVPATALWYHVLLPLARRLLEPYPRRARWVWLASTLFAALLLFVALPVELPHHGQARTLVVRALAERSAEALGQEVHLLALRTAGSEGEAGGTWRSEGAWTAKDGVFVFAGAAPAELTWSGQARSDLELVLVRHPWSGRAQVRWGDGWTRTVDLHAKSTRPLVLTLPLESGGAAWAAHALAVAAHLALLLAALLLAALGIARAGEGRRPSALPPPWALSAVAAVGGLVCLLAVWPGSMTSDSLDQWGQLSSGALSDSHPAIYAATIWVLTRVWSSPAPVVLTQVAVCALLAGAFARELGRMGAPAWTLWASVALLSGWPAVGLMLATVWKDVPFAIAMLGLSLCLLRAVRTGGAWLRSRAGLAWTTAALLAVALYRHNGVLVVAGVVGLLALMRGWRRAAVILGIASVVGFGLVKGPVYRLLGVQPAPRAFALQNQVHQLAALVAAGAELQPEDVALLESVLPLDRWSASYVCQTAANLLYQPAFNPVALNQRPGEFVALLSRLGRANPGALWQRQVCISSVVWRVRNLPVPLINTYAFGPDPNPYGIELRPPLPGLSESVHGLAQWTELPPQVSVLWRPALVLYVLMGAVALAAVRRRSAAMLLVGAPVVLNSLAMLALAPSQSVRYQGAVFFVGLFAPALALVERPVPTATAGTDGAGTTG